MMNNMTDVAAFVLPSVVAVAAAAAVIGGAFMRRQIPAAVAATRPHATDLGLGWAGSAFGTSGVMTKRAFTSYDPQSRGSTG